MHDLRSGRLQFFVDVSINANFGTQAWPFPTVTKYSLAELNLVMLDLTLLVLSHKYTDWDLFHLIHYEEYPIVPDLPGML
jgi:hypothetical protein